ncbi:MAG: hypothetical protein CSA66_02375 [Proteobacteria bacterium]|nr:MAG: hypothetical protein CSA66_02375 [Pseudomonadota bacterium]
MRSLALAPLLVVLLLGMMPKDAQAALDLRRVDTFLAELPYGGDIDAVARWLQKRLEQRYAPKIKAALDDNERAKLRAQLDREVFDFRSRVIVFDGRRTGYEVSPIAGEFLVGSNESLAVYRERQGDLYFFFINGRLWKFGRADRPDSPFADRIATHSRRLGKPDRVVNSHDARGREVAPVKAAWQDDRVTVRLWNRRLLYGYDVLFVQHRPIADRIDELRGGRAASDQHGGVDPDLESFLLGEGEDEEDELRRKELEHRHEHEQRVEHRSD